MADQAISAYTDGSPLAAGDMLVIERPGTPNVNRKVLGESVAQVLIWDGSADYTPASLKASTLPKTFIGPTDPTTVTGVTMNLYDRWEQT